jgi:hypothetical protein
LRAGVALLISVSGGGEGEMTGTGLKQLAFVLLAALILYVGFTGGA